MDIFRKIFCEHKNYRYRMHKSFDKDEMPIEVCEKICTDCGKVLSRNSAVDWDRLYEAKERELHIYQSGHMIMVDGLMYEIQAGENGPTLKRFRYKKECGVWI